MAEQTTPVSLSFEDVLKESEKALRFLEQFFDSRGYDQTPLVSSYIVTMLAHRSPEEAWDDIKARLADTLRDLASEGLNWTRPNLARLFEEGQKELLAFDNKVLVKG